MYRSLILRRAPAVVLAVTGALITGCSRPAPEERLLAVGEDLSAAEVQLETIDERIAEHEEAVYELRMDRQRAKRQLMTLEDRLRQRATDLAIFRAAQSALLDDPALQDAAISVRVEDRVVILHGSISTEQEQQRATEIVRAVPGVKKTIGRLQLVTDDEPGDS